ncbi:MAG: hypothetical protein U0807_04425 [Candidatus Binatia bacterium]
MPSSAPPVLRNALVLTGILLLGVGLADALVGRAKLAQYNELLRAAPAPEAAKAPSLFPTASEGQERSAVVRAKLGFYQLLVTCGWTLVCLGSVLVTTGVLHVRLRGLSPPRHAQQIN